MRIRNWFRLRKLETDLDRELRYHLDRRTEDLMASGVSRSEARRHALLELGGAAQVREEVRDVWLTRWARDFVFDLHFSARSFLRSPSFTATAVLSLALGIGAATAIYSLLDQVVLHALPVREPQRLVMADWKGEQAAVNAFGSYNLMSYPICRELQLQDRIFEGVFCRALTRVTLSIGGDPQPTAAEIVSGSYFPVLGIGASIGRLLTAQDDQPPGRNPVLVISHDFWKTRFAGSPDVVGKKVLLNNYPVTIVGVAPPGFHGIDVGEVPSVWIPAPLAAQVYPGFNDMLSHRVRWMQVLGRLRSSVTAAEAQAGLQPWFRAMLQEDTRRPDFPRLSPERRSQYFASVLEITPAPAGHSSLRRKLAQPLWVLFGATAVLLGLACLNVAGLFIARGSARGREITTRFALGASRGRIGRQLVADSILIALAGGLLGVVLAPAIMKILIAFLPRETAAHALEASVNPQLLLFAAVVSVMAGLLTGLAPALQTGRHALISNLRERGASGGGLRLRRLIVTAQIALTLILVIGAALFVRTLNALMSKGPGFDTSSLISFRVEPLQNGYSPAAATRLVHRIHDEIQASSLTQASAIARFQLLTGGSWNDRMTIQAGQRFHTDRDVHLNAITPGFFSTLGARMVAGRGFDERDTIPVPDGKFRLAVVNEEFVKRYLPGRNPIGVHFGYGIAPDVVTNIEIIGVVANISYRGVREEREQAYFPLARAGSEKFEGGVFYVRVHGRPENAFEAFRKIVHRAAPGLPVTSLRTLDDQVRLSLNTERMLATLSGGFGILALILSLVGLYGVMSFAVTQRTREIGIRLALGATRVGTVWLVLRDALAMIASGILIALACTWVLGRLIAAQLYAVEPTDPATNLAATLILCAAALAAAFIPAHRAASVNPMNTLRFE